MKVYLAHSAGENHPAQSYEAHVRGVTEKASHFAHEAGGFGMVSPGQLENIVNHAAAVHDLGKLTQKNQDALRDGKRHRNLPINHVDAGTAFCLSEGDAEYSAIVVFSHHKGLPNFAEEDDPDNAFRDKHAEVRQLVDREQASLLEIHNGILGSESAHIPEEYGGDKEDKEVFLRLILSCIADADHTDSAIASGALPTLEYFPDLRAGERLIALDNYVATLGGKHENERDTLRKQMYTACRNADKNTPIVSCSSPVGTGKTTAIMAHLLRCAEERKARRIFVVLPFTNIIKQSVDVYRKALVLQGEDPEQVVAELHHKADYEDEGIRHLSALWRAPIIVTTAVAFFETLASNRPAGLRRLHELPGSVIFVDEAHACLPVPLLPVTWKWMQTFADEWSCQWVLASGSLVKFWEIEKISRISRHVPELVPDALRNQLAQYEEKRISYHYVNTPLHREELIEMVSEQPGPRLLIVNTVQTAAVIADGIKKRFGRDRVEHLSTALSPSDRDKVIDKIKLRLEDRNDQDWTLVATSCVEAGVDLSFRTGFREIASLLSLLQAAGRINRNGQESDAIMYCFSLQDDDMLSDNPMVKNAALVLERFFQKGKQITPELSTEAIEEELYEYGLNSVDLLEKELDGAFRTVCEKYRVIDSETVLAVTNPELAERIRYGGGDWRSLQKHAVSIRQNRIRSYHLKEIRGGIYEWTLPYDDFLGFMRGVLDEKAVKGDFLCC